MVRARFNCWEDIQKLIDDEDTEGTPSRISSPKTKADKDLGIDPEKQIKQIEKEWDNLSQRGGSLHFTPNRFMKGELNPTGVDEVPGAHPSVFLREIAGVFYWVHSTSNKKKVDELIGFKSEACHPLPAESLTRLDYESLCNQIKKVKPRTFKKLEEIEQGCHSKFPIKETYFIASHDMLHRSPWNPKRDTYICLSETSWLEELELKTR